MRQQTETDPENRDPVGQAWPRNPDRLGAAPGDGRLAVIACDGCGRSFATEDGPAMIAAIEGACPDCGGRFQMTPAVSGSDRQAPGPASR